VVVVIYGSGRVSVISLGLRIANLKLRVEDGLTL
jgi:hypothetical protein